MFDPLDLLREDTPTPAPTPRPAREDTPPADQARQATTTPPARTGPASGPAIAAPVPNGPARPSPTWGSIEPCPTQTYPHNILTATPTPPGAW